MGSIIAATHMEKKFFIALSFRLALMYRSGSIFPASAKGLDGFHLLPRKHLTQKQHLLDIHKLTRLHAILPVCSQPIEVQAAWHLTRIKACRFVSRLLGLIHKGCHNLPEEVVDLQ